MFPSKILVGITLDPENSKDLLSWAITFLSRQNDTIIALYVLAGEETKKRELTKKDRWDLRRVKAYVISLLGEFTDASQSMQLNLEAKVGFSPSIGRGLIDEAKSISADFLLLGNSKNRSNRSPNVKRYCFKHSPEGCSLILLGKGGKHQQSLDSESAHSKEESRSLSSSTWSNENMEYSERAESPVQNRGKASPRTVLDETEERDSNSTEDDILSYGDSRNITEPQSLPLALKSKPNIRRHRISPCKLISSFLGSPFRKRSCSFSNKEMGHSQSLLRCFSYEDIMIATNNFHPDNIAGQGGYSEVYRGELSDRRVIAVKRLTKDNKDAKKEKEFLIELGIIGHVSHTNTASLVGCCIENGFYLVFNFSENGNLASALHGKTCKTLEWPVRYKIAVGVAKGLHYLHKCCKHRIIHRDIKASNVLLGPDYEPQITDFGLAKWLPNKWTHHAVIPIEGTFGYLAPEYFMHGIVDEKTDVFAFGVLLLEIVTGRKPVDSSKQSLLLWAKPMMESGEIAKLADPKLKGKYDEEQLQKVVEAASYCVRQSSVWRPSMTEVLELLINGSEDSELSRSWRIPKFTTDDFDDYSMVFGYDVPSDIVLVDYL